MKTNKANHIHDVTQGTILSSINSSPSQSSLKGTPVRLSNQLFEPDTSKTQYTTDHQPSQMITVLAHQGYCQIKGPDASKLLQGQLTADVEKLTAGQGTLGALCTPKGKMISNFYVHCIDKSDTEASFVLALPENNVENTLKTLKKFGVFYKSEITEATEQWVSLGLYGIPLAEFLSNQSDRLKQLKQYSIAPQSNRFEIILPLENLEVIWNELQKAYPQITSLFWQYQDVIEGIPWVFAESSEMFLPHQLNLQAIQGISFSKGCYTGQEIIARTQYRGQTKRRMYLLSGSWPSHLNEAQTDVDSNSLVGLSIQDGDSESGKVLGEIVNGLYWDQVGYYLVTLPRQLTGQETLYLGKQALDQLQLKFQDQESSLSIKALPYENQLQAAPKE